MSIHDFSHGDAVTALTLKDRRRVTGTLAGMDFGYLPDGTEMLKDVHVFVAKSKRIFRVRPESIRWHTDKNGFSFAVNHEEARITIRRNDRKLLSVKWMKRYGIKKLMQSMGKIK